MPIVYNKALDMMKERKLTTYKIRQEKIIPEGTLQNLRKNKPVSTETIATLCKILKCQPGDLMEYVDEV